MIDWNRRVLFCVEPTQRLGGFGDSRSLDRESTPSGRELAEPTGYLRLCESHRSPPDAAVAAAAGVAVEVEVENIAEPPVRQTVNRLGIHRWVTGMSESHTKVIHTKVTHKRVHHRSWAARMGPSSEWLGQAALPEWVAVVVLAGKDDRSTAYCLLVSSSKHEGWGNGPSGSLPQGEDCCRTRLELVPFSADSRACRRLTWLGPSPIHPSLLLVLHWQVPIQVVPVGVQQVWARATERE